MSTVSTGTVRYRAEAGASLLETMVAGALGVVIIGTALQLFVTHHGHFLGQRTQAELQQDIRWGVQLLAAELRLAGALPDQVSLSTMATDEVIFRANTNRVSGVLQADAAVGQDVVAISPGSGWAKGKAVILCGASMCEEHVLARDGASGRLTLSQVLARDFPAGSRIEVVNTVRYYLSRSDAKNGKLMREVDHGSNPLIEHVENFSLTYLNERGQSVERLEDVRIIRLYLKTSGIDGRGGRLQRSYTRDMGVRSL